MVGPAADWLENPAVIEVCAEEDSTWSAVVTFRTTDVRATVQPHREALAFFHLGEDDRPVYIEFLERLSGSCALKVLSSFVEQRNGRPLTPTEIAALANAMSDAQERLEEVASSARTEGA